MQNNYNNTQFELTQLRDQKFQVNVFSGKIDVEKKFKNEMKLEIGGLYASADSKSDSDIEYFEKSENDKSSKTIVQ